jgi:hypothetical protein
MATTREELESFQQFASERLSRTGSEPSLDELLLEWADDRDRLQINEAIRRGLADVEAGRYEPADVAMEKIRAEFGIPRE